MIIPSQTVTKRVSNLFTTISKRNKYTLPCLPYEYNALEPVISEEIMRTHHDKHHQTYVSNLNAALEKFEEAKNNNDLSAAQTALHLVNFNGGGHLNHSIFWHNLCPQDKAKEKPSGSLLKAIEHDFDNFDNFKSVLSSQAAAIQGSGWGWLGYNPSTKSLQITTTSNQDTLASRGLIPLLGIDVWEHAYYLQYKSARAEYIKNIWSIINWDDVASRFSNAINSKKK